MDKFLHFEVGGEINSVHVYGNEYVNIKHRYNGLRGIWGTKSAHSDVEILKDEPTEKVVKVGVCVFHLLIWKTGRDEEGDVYTVNLTVKEEREESIVLWAADFSGGVPYSCVWVEE